MEKQLYRTGSEIDRDRNNKCVQKSATVVVASTLINEVQYNVLQIRKLMNYNY